MKAQPPVSFFAAIAHVEQAGVIEEVMRWAEVTYDAAKQDRRFGKFKQDSLDDESLAAILKYTAQDTEPAFFSCMNLTCYDQERSLVGRSVPSKIRSGFDRSSVTRQSQFLA